MDISIPGWIALAAGTFAASIIIVYLFRQPELTLSVKGWLGLGLGVFPILMALAGNLHGLEETQQRRFCTGGCHVMDRHGEDAANLSSVSLASIHSRNNMFGKQSCYECHADYGMFGMAVTKLNGLSHVVNYVLSYHAMPMDVAMKEIRLNHPYQNRNCMQCHSTQAPSWLNVPDHAGLLEDLVSGSTSCVSAGCHGPVHPFNKSEEELQ